MERAKLFNLITLVLTFVAVVPKLESQIMPPVIPMPQPPLRPLCASQLALVNYACGRLPIFPGSPLLPLTPPPSPDDEEGHRSHHRRGHRHGHGHQQSHRHNPQEDNCCRWAREVDTQCVCQILVLLPPFLMRPLHQYSVIIGESCNVTYSCGGPI
ncbi:uncharacterized protein LOC133294580 [Gastrolobium bilobum]|uniref:uncharacterized protein LOC133294580 n=1 Tax=Gastrolobium bilobum TaxID=150636 RepID=UPI002AB10349|nr:uncharacterized protein LOC133294580 [Gastrolobium bilobum]